MDRLERRHGRDLEHLLRGRHQHDRIEALDRIERRGRRQRHVDGERLRAEVQRVAVGRSSRGGSRADIAAAAGTVLDHDLLAPHLRQLVGDEAAQNVDRARRRERDDHLHRPFGIFLRRRRAAEPKHKARSDSQHSQRFQGHGRLPRLFEHNPFRIPLPTSGCGSLERAFLGELVPFRDLGLEMVGKPVRRAADEAVAERQLLLPHVRQVDHRLKIAVDLVDDRLRRALGREEAVPARTRPSC